MNRFLASTFIWLALVTVGFPQSRTVTYNASNGVIGNPEGGTLNFTSIGTLVFPADFTRLGSSIALTSEVTGILPSANGGAGTVSGVLKANGSGVTSAAVAGTDYTSPTGSESLTNKTINGSSNTITNVSLTAGITGTLGYANGGTNAATQSAARTNLGGTRVENANSGTGETTTPGIGAGDYTGQILLNNYGRLWWWNGANWKGGFIFPQNCTFGSNGSTGIMAATDDHKFIVGDTGDTIDNVIRIRNDNLSHYSAMAFNRATADGGGEMGAIGGGNSNSSTTFRNRLYFESYGGLYDIVVCQNIINGVTWKWEAGTGDYISYTSTAGSGGQGTEVIRMARATGNITTTGIVTGESAAFSQTGNQTATLGLANTTSATTGTGTLAASLNANTVTGSGTSFTTELEPGSIITVGVTSYKVTTVTSNTALTVCGRINPAITAGTTFTHTRPGLRSYTGTAGRNLWHDSTGDLVVTRDSSPSIYLDIPGTRSWSLSVGSANSNEWALSNVTSGASPFVVNGNAGNSEVRITSAGLDVAQTLILGSGNTTVSSAAGLILGSVVDIAGTTDETSIEAADSVLIRDSSASANREATLTSIFTSRTLISPTVGASGTALTSIISATSALNFDLTAVESQDLTIALTGAVLGDVVSLGVPHASVTADTIFTAWVSAADTITVRAMRIAGTPDPSSGTFRAAVTRF